MLVRSLRDHYHDVYRKEGEEFDFSGELYEHIQPADPAEAAKLAKAAAAEDKQNKKTEQEQDQKSAQDKHDPKKS